MRWVSLIVLVLAMAATLAAALGVREVLRSGTPPGETAPTLLLVATRFIPAGTIVDERNTKIVYGEGGLSVDPYYLRGRVLLVDILRGQALQATDFRRP